MAFREDMGGAMEIFNHMYFLKKEIAYLTKYAETLPDVYTEDIHTTISVLQRRYDECKKFSDDFMKAARPLIEHMENIE
jgi:hypothetical protein